MKTNIFSVVASVFAGLISAELAFGAPALTIQSPLNGAVFSPGQTVAVSVTGTEIASASYIMVIAENPLDSSDVVENGAIPFSTSISIPQYAQRRTYKIRAIAKMLNGQIITSPTVQLVVRRSDSPVSIRMSLSSPKLRFIGDQGQATVEAQYADGTIEALTTGAGVSFQSENGQIFSVSGDGLLTAKSAGAGLVRATFVSLTAVAPVQVCTPTVRGDLNGDGFVDQNDVNLLMTYLNRSSSGPGDARDLNGDGKIDALDIRIITTICTRPRCAIQ